MKTHSLRRRRGFTLIELLVVIAIIAVLAAAGFSAGTAAVNRAKKLKAQSAATAIELAINSFKTDYGYLPDPTGNASEDTELKTDSKELLEMLLGTEDQSDDMGNPRKIKYLSVKEGKGKKDGLIYATGGGDVEALYDPWGNPYTIVMDYNYDERVETPGATTTTLNGRSVAVYSPGADKIEGNADDVKTW
jgi:prepilin-type N-terminal cleavage/methylation domain-containing protein